MLGTLKTLISGKEQADAASAKGAVPLTQLEPGSALHFSLNTSVPELRGKRATIQAVRTYRFGEATTVSYLLAVDAVDALMLTIAEDEEGYYLGISRELNPDQQHLWFDRDALSFFTEPSSAKTLKARVKDAQFPGWVAPKYVKTIEFMQGTLTQGRLSTSDAARKTQPIEYNLLVSDEGDKAVEIELYPELKAHRLFVTVYRPAEDIVQITRPIPQIPVPSSGKVETMPVIEKRDVPLEAAAKPVELPVAAPEAVVAPTPSPQAAAPIIHVNEAPAAPAPVMASKPGFRRASVVEEAPVIRRPEMAAAVKLIDADAFDSEPPVPSFLTKEASAKDRMTRSKYLTLDEVLPPEIERVRCDISTAKMLIDESVRRGVRVRDLLRTMTGLQTPAHDEVLFEMPLSDEDYKQLAQRYQLKPDMRGEIRRRMMEELQKKLRKMNA